MENLEQIDEDIEDFPMEKKPKVKKVMTEAQKANLQKGRDTRKANSEQKKKEVEDKIIKAVSNRVISQPIDPPKTPPNKKKTNKQTIVICDNSDSSEDETPRIVIKRKKNNKPKQRVYETESEEEEEPQYIPPQPPQQNYIKLVRGRF